MRHVSLMLQSSSGQLSVGFASGGELIFDSEAHPDLRGSRNVSRHIIYARDREGVDLEALDRVFVDLGPGGLGATRNAVAFANALAWARGVPVVGINAFELMGHHVEKICGKPVICIRRAAHPNFFAGRYCGGCLQEFGIHDLQGIKDMVRRNRDGHGFAGQFQFGRSGAAPECDLPEPVANVASMASFLEVAQNPRYAAADSRRVYPITAPPEAQHA